MQPKTDLTPITIRPQNVDPELQAIVDAWGRLPAKQRTSLAALADTFLSLPAIVKQVRKDQEAIDQRRQKQAAEVAGDLITADLLSARLYSWLFEQGPDIKAALQAQEDLTLFSAALRGGHQARGPRDQWVKALRAQVKESAKLVDRLAEQARKAAK